MRILYVVLSALAPCFSYAQPIPERKLDAPVERVKVYANQAQIFRKAEVELEPGRYNLLVEGLSEHLDPNTIQVEGKGGGIIGSVTPRRTFLNRQAASARYRSLIDSMAVVKSRFDALENERLAWRQQEELLLANKKLSGGKENLTAEQLRSMADFFQARLHEIKTASSRLEEARQVENEKWKRLNNEKNLIEMQRNEASYTAVVQFEVVRRAEVEIILKYLVYGAGWKPEYLVRSTGVGAPLQFKMKAAVFNRTGVDWENVELALSTAQPQKDVALPILEPWRYAALPKKQAMLMREQLYGKPDQTIQGSQIEVVEEDLIDGKARKVVDASGIGLQTVQQSNEFVDFSANTLAQEFAIDLAYTIPADGQTYDVQVREVEAEAEYEYYAAPKLSSDVFLQARLPPGRELNLLPGPAQVYFEGGFVGRTTIEPFSAEDTLSFGLGADANVFVERKMDDQYSKAQTFGKNRKLARGYKIKVRNQKNRAVFLVLEDQIPLAERSEVSVELLEQTGAAYDEKTGKLTWRLELGPDESRNLRFAFEIKYPESWELVGF